MMAPAVDTPHRSLPHASKWRLRVMIGERFCDAPPRSKTIVLICPITLRRVTLQPFEK
jgi:hypothetical protein